MQKKLRQPQDTKQELFKSKRSLLISPIIAKSRKTDYQSRLTSLSHSNLPPEEATRSGSNNSTSKALVSTKCKAKAKPDKNTLSLHIEEQRRANCRSRAARAHTTLPHLTQKLLAKETIPSPVIKQTNYSQCGSLRNPQEPRDTNNKKAPPKGGA